MRVACPAPPSGAPRLKAAFDKAQLGNQTPEAKELGEKIAAPLAVGVLLLLLSLVVR